MNDRLLHNTTHTALTERMKPKICAINDAVGNIFRYRQKLYIVTCKHVADDFFSQNHQYIILRGNSRIYRDNLKYIASTNSAIDIALIEILHSSQVSEYFEEDDLEIIDDYDNKEIENAVFFIFGFPEQLYFNKDGKQYIPWMSYMTIKSKNKKSDGNFIYLDYEVNNEKNIINEKKLKSILPKAPGLSGAFIFKVDRFEGEKNELWKPSIAKAIAIQSTWNEKSWIKGSNIKYLYKLLNTAT